MDKNLKNKFFDLNCEILENKKKKISKGYLGFEVSGKPHLGWIFYLKIIKKFIKKKKFIIFLADIHSEINDKNYKAHLKSTIIFFKNYFSGEKNLSIVIGSDFLKNLGWKYWNFLIKLGKNLNLSRIFKSLEILGRREEEGKKDFSKLIYPLMQISDIFFLKVDFVLSGMDQRKIHVLCKEIFKKKKIEPPTFIHFPIISSLTKIEGKEKMSKSIEKGNIYLNDSKEEIKKKILKSYLNLNEKKTSPLLNLIEKISKISKEINFFYNSFSKKFFFDQLNETNVKFFKEKFSELLFKFLKEFN